MAVPGSPSRELARRQWVVLAAALAFVFGACTAGPLNPSPSALPTDSASPSLGPTAAPTSAATPFPEPTDRPTDPPADGPDMILVGGPLITVDADFSIASGIGLRDGRIVAVGTADEVRGLASLGTTVVELDGRAVMPGIVDPHVHELQFESASIDGLNATQERLFSFGRTTVGNPSIYPDVLLALQAWVESGDVKLRHHLYVSYNDNCGDVLGHWYADQAFGRDPGQVQAIAGIKLFMDGGSCNSPAATFRWHNPRWEGRGHLYAEADEVAEVARRADELGAQLVMHVGGDRALDAAFDGLAAALTDAGNPNRHRLDHNMIVRPDQLPRYSEIGVAPIVFGSDQACLRPLESREEAWLSAEQLAWLAPHRAMLDANPDLPIGWHSDAPLLTPDFTFDLFGLTEFGDGFRLEDGTECHVSDELRSHAVTLREAITMMTMGSAYAMQLEHEVGSLEAGKAADLIVLVNNPLDQSGIELLNNEVVMTVAAGQVVWCNYGLAEFCSELLPPT